MKGILLLVALLFCGTIAAQNSNSTTQDLQFTEPEYAYCMIIGNSTPSSSKYEVLFDFGQKTSTFKYNYIEKKDGKRYKFNSIVEALNFMERQGWKFVQAYTSGKDGCDTHMVLRIATSNLTQEQRQKLVGEPDAK